MYVTLMQCRVYAREVLNIYGLIC